jgi:hypothetical protein
LWQVEIKLGDVHRLNFFGRTARSSDAR